MEKLEKEKIKFMFVGGHLTPALAVLEELKVQGYTNIVWTGRKYSQEGDKRKSSEFKLIKSKGIKFYNLNTGRLQRKWVLKTLLLGLKNLLMIPFGFLKAFNIVLKEKPDIVISFGGYLALPIVCSAKVLNRKIVTHEQTVVTGLANKFIAKLANRVFISWDISRKYFPAKKTVLTGNPLRKEVFQTGTNDFDFHNDRPIVYVTGGSQGSNTINWRLLEILPKLLKHANVIHQTGSSTVTQDYEKALKKKKRLNKKLQENYVVRKHIFGRQIGEIFAKSTLVVSRSGANTLTELLALGRPAVLIPIPWSSGDEQMKNARMIESIGLATVLTQEEITPDLLYNRILNVLEVVRSGKGLNGYPLDLVRITARSKVKLNAAENIVNEIENIICEKK
ncbi:UDP-N-acetylglucosamine--N-acetylmuramyl-(pentapeptide) pyrophosphoryl-undecaprenol N-acetylglucosamine transferase [Candidatus Dojkabacteria bacterium]|nr:UDP-N-acetylglucosamine--N-acetylmuramyl-(pentapeptide) pyrophosphoryl-undecaprenol N-acetylglucosamine transferase [Candidatus Dojkabacteria bacterium]